MSPAAGRRGPYYQVGKVRTRKNSMWSVFRHYWELHEKHEQGIPQTFSISHKATVKEYPKIRRICRGCGLEFYVYRFYRNPAAKVWHCSEYCLKKTVSLGGKNNGSNKTTKMKVKCSDCGKVNSLTLAALQHLKEGTKFVCKSCGHSSVYTSSHVEYGFSAGATAQVIDQS